MALKTLEDFKNELAKAEGFENAQDILIKSKYNADLVFDQSAEQYAEYIAVEFNNFTYEQCEEIDGGTLYKGKTYSVEELYKIFKEQNK